MSFMKYDNIFINQLHAVSRTRRGRQREPGVKYIRFMENDYTYSLHNCNNRTQI